MRLKIIAVFLIIMLIFLTILFFPVKRNYTFFAFSTVCNITFYNLNIFEFKKMTSKAKKLCEIYEKKYSVNINNSLISNLNLYKKIPKDDELAEILLLSKKVSEKLNGKFDITIQPILKLWGFDNGLFKKPDDNDIKRELENVDFKQIKITENSIIIGENQLINTGAFSKGLIIDKVYELFVKDNIDEFLIEFGGDIRVFSKKNKIFKIAIKNPETNDINKVLNIKSGQSVATTGDYERFFEFEKIKYHHIISGITGYPEFNIRSVTVISDNALNADMLSTAFFLADYNTILKNSELFPFEECYFFEKDSKDYKIIKK
ncbi:MAG: FAD:protein FMN transferase [Candidatus Muirbacterium halophilum]|nr:FAD:protein FMN transferase [Candidatus Muirbacterium halophilum]MCK9475458.1 FAD:protein FMN transferase [Candidatus Muirbacterium halophilum]